jgi:transglutaminase-like putative cysteine protease
MMACAGGALLITGGGETWLGAALAVVMIAAWKLEGTKWQLSERTGLVVLLLSLPLFYIDWKVLEGFEPPEQAGTAGVSALAHLTVFLCCVKLLQVKSDRDWLFIYLVTFFQVLLAAGLSISPLFVVALCIYVFCSLLTVLCFEVRKASRRAPASETRLLIAHEKESVKSFSRRGAPRKAFRSSRLSLAALCLFVLIFALSLPIFFVTPRLGDGPVAGGGARSYVGFSETMKLGDIGKLQQVDQLVMRVRVDEPAVERNRNLRWRGVALDSFDGLTWKRSDKPNESFSGGERGFIQLGTTEGLERLTTQTFFIEPTSTPVLFVAPRAVALQGSFPSVSRGKDDALTAFGRSQGRISYRAYSDTVEPAPDVLRADPYRYPRNETRHLRAPITGYLQLPEDLDSRVESLAGEIIKGSGGRNAYDAARAIESYFNNEYSYTLEMNAGGTDPLADFLFRVRAGHCEYFSTAMTIMLRTQGIAARVVNGFQTGDYNDAADAYVVKQHHAHSWVEVYFPAVDTWVSFDPTPAAGRPGDAAVTEDGISARLTKYAEALDLFWIQYVVAYDRQEQRSLANSVRGQLSSYTQTLARATASLVANLRAQWEGRWVGAGASGVRHWIGALLALTIVAAILLVYARRRKLKSQKRKADVASPAVIKAPAISFYSRMVEALKAQGMQRAMNQTPLEFAASTGMPEAVRITRAYHQVRYGAQSLSSDEASEIEKSLRRIEGQKR